MISKELKGYEMGSPIALDTRDKIRVMEWFVDGGKVISKQYHESDFNWKIVSSPQWNWNRYDYRVLKKKDNK